MSRARHIARKRGGGVPTEDKAKPVWNAGGSQNEAKEAEEKKRGGRVHRASGGFVQVRAHKRARGGHVDGHDGQTHHHVKPASMHHRHGMKVPGRKSGGKVGSDHNPLSSAAKVKEVGKGMLPEEGTRSN